MDCYQQTFTQVQAPTGLPQRSELNGGRDALTAVASVRPKTVAICDTQPVTNAGIRSIMADVADLKFLLAVESLESALEVMHLHVPDVLVIDKAFGDKAILQWLSRVRLVQTRSGVVVWGVSFIRDQALRLVHAGAQGILRKTAAPGTVLDCLQTVAAGRIWLDDSIIPDAYREGRYANCELTAREREVVALVEQGFTNEQIGREIGIRVGTVKVHLKHAFEKTGSSSRFSLALARLGEQISGGDQADGDCRVEPASGPEFLIEAPERSIPDGDKMTSSGYERSIAPEPAKFHPEHRREPRIPVDERASLHLFHPLVAGRSAIVAVDRSPSGLRIIGPYSASVGALVQVRLKDALVLGEVRHCAAVAGGFRIGIFVENSMPLKLKTVA